MLHVHRCFESPNSWFRWSYLQRHVDYEGLRCKSQNPQTQNWLNSNGMQELTNKNARNEGDVRSPAWLPCHPQLWLHLSWWHHGFTRSKFHAKSYLCKTNKTILPALSKGQERFIEARNLVLPLVSWDNWVLKWDRGLISESINGRGIGTRWLQ